MDPDSCRISSRFEFEGLSLRFFQEQGHRRDDEAAARAGGGARRAGHGEEDVFAGEKINFTEDRAVLHIALRNRSNTPDPGRRQGRDAGGQRRARAYEGIARTRCGPAQWKGHTGKPITDIVNIGIGGSDLGPVMVTEALKPYRGKGPPRAFRLQRGRHAHRRDAEPSSIHRDHALHRRLEDLYHAGNADQRALRARLADGRSEGREAAVAKHFVALSTNEKEVTKFGIDKANMFAFLGLGRRPLLALERHRPAPSAWTSATTIS